MDNALGDQVATGKVLFISKPLAPPWNDSGKNLARDLARNLTGFSPVVLGTGASHDEFGPGVSVEEIYRSSGQFGAGTAQNLRVLLRLFRPDSIPVYHFFFAPNPKTSVAASAILKIKRKCSVHTISSVPKSFDNIHRLLFANRIVAVSHSTAALLDAAGVHNVSVIHPCVPRPAVVSAERKAAAASSLGLSQDRPMVLFAGDYEFSRAARWSVEAALLALSKGLEAYFVFACRTKTPQALEREQECIQMAEASPWADRFRFVRQVDDMFALIASAAVQWMPADSLYAKMDIPIVLLESLAFGVPIIVSDSGALPEILQQPAGVKVKTGDVQGLADSLATLIESPQTRRDYGEAGVHLAETAFSPLNMAKKYEQVYEELLNGGNK